MRSFFCVKNTNFDFKFTQFYQYSILKILIRILLDLFIINKISFTARITAIVLLAAEHIKFRGSLAVIECSVYFEKMNYKKNFIHFKICAIKNFGHIS